MLSFFRQSLIILVFILSSSHSAYSQVSVVDSQTAVQLVQKLTGTGVTIMNPVLNCEKRANGIFTVTSSNLNLNEGIILSSGYAESAGNPSTFHGNKAYGAVGDPISLDPLVAPLTTEDACILEFDFLPIGDTIRFRYVFWF